jgi:hypothetical protein
MVASTTSNVEACGDTPAPYASAGTIDTARREGKNELPQLRQSPPNPLHNNCKHASPLALGCDENQDSGLSAVRERIVISQRPTSPI